jgi:hypothetical protein
MIRSVVTGLGAMALVASVFVPRIASAQPGAQPPQPPSPSPQPYPPAPYPQPYPPPAVQLTPEETELLAQGEISTGEMVAGGLVGSFFGLGIGHAVQGRYLDKGWIFTVGELAGGSLVIFGIVQCLEQHELDDGDCDDAIPLLVGGLLVNAGFRVWEIIDVWAGPPRHNARVRELRLRLGYPPPPPPPPPPAWGLYLSPAKGESDGKVLGLTLRF